MIKEEFNLKKIVSFLIIISLMVSFSVALPLALAEAKTGSLKTPKLQTFTTGAMDFLLTVRAIGDGVALAEEANPNYKSGGYSINRVILIDYETGKKTITPYHTAMNYDGDPNSHGFAEGWAIVGKDGALQKNESGLGYTYINSKGKSFSKPIYSYLTNFRNGIAGCRYYVGNDCYTGILQKDGKVRFAILGAFDVKIGNSYVTMSARDGNFTYDLKGNRITLTKEILEKDVNNYNASERNSFYKNYANKYTIVEYLGSNRFRVETKTSRKIVDSKNKTIVTESTKAAYGFPRAFINGNKLYIQTSKGICNKDGKLIIASSKYDQISPADGDCFVTRKKETFQMFHSSGKVIATSQYNPMVYSYQTVVETLFVWHFDSDYRTKGLACLYTDINLGNKSSTKSLKELYKKCRFDDSKIALATQASAKKLMQSNTANNIEMFSVMGMLSRYAKY